MKPFSTILSAALCVLVTQSQALEFYPGLIAFSAGSWISLPADNSPVYFNKVSATWYMTLNNWKIAAGIPIAWTVESGLQRQRLFPGDGTLSAGRRIGNFEPRAGIIAPLGYGVSSSWKSGAWIGSNNLKAQAGLSFGRGDDVVDGMPLTVEVMLSTPLTQENAFMRRGSIAAMAFVKTYHRASETIRYGLDVFILANRTVWEWSWKKRPGVWTNVVETGVSVVPNAWFENRIAGSWYYTLKAGFGPQFTASNQSPAWKYRGNSLNISASLPWYP